MIVLMKIVLLTLIVVVMRYAKGILVCLNILKRIKRETVGRIIF